MAYLSSMSCGTAPPDCLLPSIAEMASERLSKHQSLTLGVRALCSAHTVPLSHRGRQPTKQATIHQLLTLHPWVRHALRGPSTPGPLTAQFIITPLFYLTSTEQAERAPALDRFLINKLLCFTWFKFKLLFGF